METRHFNLQRLKFERISRNISAEKIGEALGISANAYYKKESGSSNISVEEFGVILEVMDIPERNAGIFFTFNVPDWEQIS